MIGGGHRMAKHILFILLIFFGAAHADLFNVTGTCITDNLSNSTYCGDNSTIAIFNITDNITYNITNTTIISIAACNITNTTLTANSSFEIPLNLTENATISCVTNSSQITVHVCNFTQSFTPSFTAQSVNSDGVNVSIAAIPESFCYQNVSLNLTNGGIYLSAATNVSVICSSGVSANCPVCETQVACPAQIVCPTQAEDCAYIISQNQLCDANLQQCQFNASNCAVQLNNSQIGCTVQLNAKDYQLSANGNITAAIPVQVQQQFEPLTSGLLLTVVGILSVYLWSMHRARTAEGRENYGKAITQADVDKLKAKMEPKEG